MNSNQIVVTQENLANVVLNLTIADKVQTKRSRLKDKDGEYVETPEEYNEVKAIEQTVEFMFANMPLSELLNSRKGVLKAARILFQDQVRKQDGDVMEWLKANPRVSVDMDELLETKRGTSKTAEKINKAVESAKESMLSELLKLNLPDHSFIQVAMSQGISEERAKKILKLRENKR